MALDQNTRHAIIAKLKTGTKPKDVADQLNVKLPTVYAINQKLQADMENDKVQELNSIPIETIAHVVEEAKKDLPLPTPSGQSAMAEQMDALVVGADGLKKLDMSFQTTITNVLRRFDMLLLDKELPLKDIVVISNTAASAYEKIFTSGTNIHIGDNNSQSNTQLSVFKNKQGV